MNIHSQPRILGLDLARALAIGGMVLVNYRIVMSGFTPSSSFAAQFEGWVEGKAVALFIVLAGVGASLGSRRARNGSSKDRLEAKRTLGRRALFLYLFGWLFMLVWPADILHFYGLYLGCGALLLFHRSRWITLSILGAWTLGTLYLLFGDFLGDWNLENLSYQGLDTWMGFFKSQFLNGYHPFFPWVTFYLVGLLVGRLDLRNLRVQNRLLGWSGLVFATASALSFTLTRDLNLETDPDSIWILFEPLPLPPMPIYPLIGASSALLILALCLKWGDALATRPRRYPHPLVATGQLAFTLYIAHVMVGMASLEAFGRLYDQSVEYALLQAALFFGLSVIFATLWRRYFRRGPLEALMRWTTDAHRKPARLPPALERSREPRID